MELETATALTRPATLQIVEDMQSWPTTDPLRIADRLGKLGLAPDLVAALQTQRSLRASLRPKIGDLASDFLGTTAGAEQATRWPIAQLRAQQMRAMGAHSVADLCCGLGVDALALAGTGMRVTAYELDEATAHLASHNLRRTGATVITGDGLRADLAGADAIFADPARRTSGGNRIHDPREYSPSLDAVWALRRQVQIMAVKVAPAIRHSSIPADARPQWTSLDGDLVETCLWWEAAGASHHDSVPRHTATIAATSPRGDANGTAAAVHIAGIPDGSYGAPTVGLATDPDAPGAYIAEPDAAIIRSHLVGTWLAQAAASSEIPRPALVAPGIAYVASVAPLPLAKNYRILETLPFHIKKLGGYLRARGVGSVTIKKRGVEVTPELVRKQLRLRGDDHATLIVTRVAGHHRALVVEPVEGNHP
ncbi:THUMP-like domain-containing protein [Rarobacter incanus]|uniref:THUMP-like domain-containing protein n=1 Tax=Rarobacter incanus TaxID=153494 RepID=A0A542SR61_9MICO|nr:class I SAM-dependent methyltransferase [Rarobacter incanus]TQK77106.1 hypothetical protein FB389_1821 [Rarobacter incanus]